MKFVRKIVVLVALGLLAAASSARAQSPSFTPGWANVDLGALITNSAAAAGTYNSPDQSGLNFSGVACNFSITGETGTPGVALNLQIKDTVSGGYTTLVSGSNLASALASNTPVWIIAHPGIQTSSLPTNVSAAIQLPLTRTWRIQEVITSAGSITGHVGCSAMR